MIQPQTILKVTDNSGAKTVKCIKILGGFNKKVAKLGDFVIVSIQKLRNRAKQSSKVKKKELYKALIVRTKATYKKNTNLTIQFNENAVILINKQENPIGTRIIGPIIKLEKKAFQKFVSLAGGLV